MVAVYFFPANISVFLQYSVIFPLVDLVGRCTHRELLVDVVLTPVACVLFEETSVLVPAPAGPSDRGKGVAS